MRFIVCGLHRTGTSALVNAVGQSSTLAVHSDAYIETVIRSREIDPQYNPNPYGYLSHGAMFAPVADWIGATPDGSVMKAAPEAFLNGAGSEPLTVVLTARAQTEIEASFAQAFGFTVPSFRWMSRINAEQVLVAAPNVTVSVVNFADMIADPQTVFETLAANGWPINATVAASTIDPTLYRNT